MRLAQQVDLLFNGDPAPTEPFEELVNIKSGNALGSQGAKALLPWLKSNQKIKYLVVLCDPRPKSPELRDTARELLTSLPASVRNNMIIVNADTPAENRRWIKKNSYDDSFKVMSDEKLSWMRSYSALGKDRWSMTAFVLEDGRVKRVARELSPFEATRAISEGVKSSNEPRLQ